MKTETRALIPITDPADPRLAAYRDLKDRDLRGRGDFIAEGEVVLTKWLAAGRHFMASILLSEHQAERLGALVRQAPLGAPVYVASQALMDKLVGFPIHRGVLAHGHAAPQPSAAAMLAELGPEAVVLALSGLANHDNVGGLFRNAAAFGVGAVVLDAACCSPLYRKAIRVSVGAALMVPFVQLSPCEDMVDVLAGAGFEVLALSPRGDLPLSALRPQGRQAILLGAEGPGLPAAVLARTRNLSIPMVEGFDSLNVSVAGAIVLHHLFSEVS